MLFLKVNAEMKCLGETTREVAQRMRQIASGLADPADAEEARRYADWLEKNSDAAEEQNIDEPLAAISGPNDQD